VRADVTGKNVLLPEQEDAELVGNACVGFFGLGDFESLPAAAERLVRFQRTFVPDQHAAEVYDEMFARFCRACECLGQTFSR
jgi:sugar (pentulose or hexulose) kinase